MEMTDIRTESDLAENRVRVEAALVRLKSIRSNIEQIRLQVELLRKMQTENVGTPSVCSECGKEIEHGQEVTVKDASGNPSHFYHRDCFKMLWASQTWKFDYSSPGFLRSLKEVTEEK
jgi:uncharacterized protein with PIN domain